jgi:hypothetical protein
MFVLLFAFGGIGFCLSLFSLVASLRINHSVGVLLSIVSAAAISTTWFWMMRTYPEQTEMVVGELFVAFVMSLMAWVGITVPYTLRDDELGQTLPLPVFLGALLLLLSVLLLLV